MKRELVRIGSIGILLLSDRLSGVTADHNNHGGNTGDGPILPPGHHHKSQPTYLEDFTSNKNELGVLLTSYEQNKAMHKETDPEPNVEHKNLRKVSSKHRMT